MPSGILALYDRVILQRPLLSLAACLLLIGFLASNLGNLKLDASADSLVLEGDEALEYFRENTARYSSEDFLLVTYQPFGDLLGDESLQTLASLRGELREIEGVASITTILDVPLLQSPPIALKDLNVDSGLPTLEDPAIDREQVRIEFRDSPIYAQLLVSPDGRTAAVQINLVRDELYVELLENRESLRIEEAAGRLTPEQASELRDAEQAFKDYSAQVLERQAVLVAEVRSTVDGYRDRASLFVGGVPMIAADMVSFIRSDLIVFGSGILLFMFLMLTTIFRRPRWVALPMLTCVASATFMLGLLATLDWRMTVISSNFVAVLLIVGLAIAIHLVVRYRELQFEHPDAEQRVLVLEMVRSMAVPCTYTTVTTAVAFGSLVVSGIRPVIDFGWMMTIGISVALLMTFIILPCVLVLLKKDAPPRESRVHDGLTGAFGDFTESHGTSILLISGLLLLVSVYGISQIEVENRFIDYFDESTEIYQGMELLDAELGGTIPLDIVIDLSEDTATGPVFAPDPAAGGDYVSAEIDEDDPFAEGLDDPFAEEDEDAFASDGDDFVQSYWFTQRGMNQLEAIHNYVDSLPETGKVLSLATTYALVKQLLGDDIGDVELALVQKSLPAAMQSLMVAPYFNEDIQQARISLRVKETSRDLRRDQFLKDLRIHLVDEMGIADEQLHFTNMLVLYNNVLQSLFRSQIMTLGAVFFAIVIMFVLLFRSLSLALIAVAPNMLAAAIVLGAMGLFGIPLDMMTITIAAIVVGIGVDDTIHYVHRFKREFPRDRNYLATMHRCHGSIGRAMYYTSITIIVGFSILVFSKFTPSIYFGLLTGLAMMAALIGALLLLPQLLITFKPLGAESKA